MQFELTCNKIQKYRSLEFIEFPDPTGLCRSEDRSRSNLRIVDFTHPVLNIDRIDEQSNKEHLSFSFARLYPTGRVSAEIFDWQGDKYLHKGLEPGTGSEVKLTKHGVNSMLSCQS